MIAQQRSDRPNDAYGHAERHGAPSASVQSVLEVEPFSFCEEVQMQSGCADDENQGYCLGMFGVGNR